MGIWSADILGCDRNCEELRDFLEIVGADVPPPTTEITVLNPERPEAHMLVRHKPEWYARLRRAYRTLEPRAVEAAYPRLVARALSGDPKRDEGFWLMDICFKDVFGQAHAARSVCTGSSFLVLSTVILASGARAPKRLLQTCVAACGGHLDEGRASVEPIARRFGGSVEDSHGVCCRQTFLRLVEKHKAGQCKILTHGVDADVVASRKCKDPWPDPAGHATRKCATPRGPLEVTLPLDALRTLDRRAFAAVPSDSNAFQFNKSMSKEASDALRAMLTEKMDGLSMGDDDGLGKVRQEVMFARTVKPEERLCGACGRRAAPGGKLLGCARCQMAYYCDRACQRTAWPDHKARCKDLAAARADVRAFEKRARDPTLTGLSGKK